MTGTAFIANVAGNLLCYDMCTDPPTLRDGLAGHTGSIRCLSLYRPKPEEKVGDETVWLFSGSFDTTVLIWHITTPITGGEVVVPAGALKGGPVSSVRSVLYIPPLGLVAVGYENGSLAFFDKFLGNLWHIIPEAHEDPITSLKWAQGTDSHTLLSGGGLRVKMWSLPLPPLRMYARTD